jgi:hypothetical protein
MKKKFLFRGLALGLAIAGFAVTPAFAATNPLSSVDTSWCTNPLLSRPFVSDGDTNEYMLVPGQSPGEFDGTGWTLTGGA